MAVSVSPKYYRILVVERERRPLAAVLAQAGYRTETIQCCPAGDDQRLAELFDAAVIDACQPGHTGLRTLRALRRLQPDCPAIVISEWDDVAAAVEAMRLGAADFVTSPVSSTELLHRVAQTLAKRRLEREVGRLRRQTASRAGIVGRSAALQRTLDMVERVAPTRTSVLLSGETGTGKELFARAVHEFSPRREGPFVPVNCAALPEHVMESELFGHRRGSFTGAIADRRGLFEEARGGTVFLDEVSSISPAIQVKLLRVLQDRQVKRVGANALEEIDFRLVAATNADLQQLVAEGAFRADLYYRLSVVLITIPPLRDRRTDIPLLVRHFADRCAAERKLAPPPIPESLLDSLMRRPWPGNVRELEHWVERTLVTSPDGRFESAEPGRPPSNRPVLDAAVSGEWNLEMLERRYIESMLHQCDDNRTAAARALGIDRRTLHRKLKRFRLDRPQDSGW